MASAAEQMAANLSWSAFGKATELRSRILFTIGLLMVYRLGTYIPVPGIDGGALRDFMEGAAAGIGGILAMFTGGALSRMGIFALGIMPYISASIIVQLLGSMYEPWKQLKSRPRFPRSGQKTPSQKFPALQLPTQTLLNTPKLQVNSHRLLLKWRLKTWLLSLKLRKKFRWKLLS